MQVGDEFAIVGADRGLRKDVRQAIAPASIDLVESKRCGLGVGLDRKSAVAGGGLEQRIAR